MIIGAPFSPHKARVPVSLNITSLLPYCKRQKGALRHPRSGSRGGRTVSLLKVDPRSVSSTCLSGKDDVKQMISPCQLPGSTPATRTV